MILPTLFSFSFCRLWLTYKVINPAMDRKKTNFPSQNGFYLSNSFDIASPRPGFDS